MIIVIEGTDCSGKQTQAEKLVKKLNSLGKKVVSFGFPNYNSPTGKIIGGAYLGKKDIGEGLFPEGAPNVPSKVASLYFLADRVYNLAKIQKFLDEGNIVVLDRYVESNMAFQGGKIFDKTQRVEMYEFLHNLEYNIFELPKPDLKIFLYMPYEQACILKQNRPESADQHEQNESILRNAETAYKEMAQIYNFKTIECTENKRIKSIEEISKQLTDYVLEQLSETKK